MKKYIIIAIAAMSAISCNLLDLAPEDNHSSNSFWKNKSHVDGFMTGLTGDLRSSYTMMFVLGEARGGTLKTGTSSMNQSLDYDNPIKSNDFTKDKTGISNWYGIYTKLMQINLFISKVESLSFLSEPDKNLYLGQAHGLRAYYYFMLYRTFGGVPKIISVELMSGSRPDPGKLYSPRETPENILNFIKEDINKSETYFGNNFVKNPVLWTKAATLMLKAEIYLWSAKCDYFHTPGGSEDLKVAKKALEEILSSGKYALEKDFTSVFTVKGNNEIIFALRFADNEAENWGGAFLYQQNLFEQQKYSRDGELYGDVLDLKAKGGPCRHEYKESLWKSYDEQDLRRDKTFLDFYADKNRGGFGMVLRKAIGSVNSNGQRIFDTDIIIYRYADALLMMAEVANGLGEDCAPYINKIRERAYGNNYSSHVYTDNHDYAANELAILHERDKEFVWEGKRWFDVVRMRDGNKQSLVFSAEANYSNDSSPAGPILTPDKKYMILWPVDINTLNNDKLLKQTPGYGGDEADWK